MTRQLLGLHLRSFEEPLSNTRMPVEQGGTAGHCHEHYLGSRSSVPLPLHLPPTTQQSPYGGEYAKMEAWMDENPEFVQDYFIRFEDGARSTKKCCSNPNNNRSKIFRKATRQVVDAWLVSHAANSSTEISSPTHANSQSCSSRGGSGATTPVR